MNFGNIFFALGSQLTTGKAVLKAAAPPQGAGLGTAFEQQILRRFYGGAPLEIALTQPAPSISPVLTDGELVLDGTAPFLSADILAPDGTIVVKRRDTVRVKARFHLTAGDLTLSLEFVTPTDLDTMFPSLPRTFRNAPDTQDLDTAADELAQEDDEHTTRLSVFGYLSRFGRVTDAKLILTSSDTPGGTTALSVAASIAATGALGVIEAIPGFSATLNLAGPVVLPSSTVLDELEPGEHAWDFPDAPGLHLSAPLTVNALNGLPLSDFAFRVYSALGSNSIGDRTAYEPEIGITGKAKLSTNPAVSIDVAGTRAPGSTPVFLAARSADLSLENGLNALTTLLGGQLESTALIPQEVTGALQNIRLTQAAIEIEREGAAGLHVASASAEVAIGLSISADSAVGDNGIQLDRLSLFASDPFTTAARSISATLSGTATFLGAQFGVKVEGPEFSLRVEQNDSTPVNLSDLLKNRFDALESAPLDVQLSDLRFAIAKGGKFAISASIKEDTPHEIGGTSFPRVDVAISNDSWRVSASSDSGVPVLNILTHVAGKLGLGTVNLPPALDELTVKSFSVERTKPADKPVEFKISSSGEIPVSDGLPPLQLTLEVTSVKGGSLTFGGTVVVGGIQFAVAFQKTGGSKVLVGSFSLEDGADADDATIHLADLANLAGFDEAANLPDIAVTLKSAFLAYRKSGNAKQVVFGVDVGPSIPLGHTDLSKFGVAVDVSDAAFRFLISSANLDVDAAGDINGLLPKGVASIPAEVRENGLAVRKGVDASLRLGTLTIGQEASDSLPEPAGGGASPAAADADKPEDNITWFNVQRHLGPLHVQRIGAGFQKAQTANGQSPAKIQFLLDAAVSVAGLTLGMQGLSIATPLDQFTPDFNLNGLSLSVTKPPIDISGAFLKRGDDFLGAAVIKVNQLTLSAVGGYRLPNPPDPASFFIFAALDYPIGGPSFFFVTGLAAGFGYNRDLVMPTIEQVSNFPFLRLLAGPEEGGTPLDAADPNPAQTILTRLTTPADLVPVRAGAMWLAVGLKFNSFKLIDCSALLLVRFGQDLEFMLIGLASLKLPKEVPAVPRRATYLQANLAFRVSIKPAEGLFAAEAVLAPGSFVLDKSCRLTGGFAFYVWFAKEHAGDFVLTLGGYHPRFVRPSHYPVVERLGINFSLDKLSIKGQAYFALTPSCVMAGGSLEASYVDGTVSAFFIARADFLIRWQPFFYDIELSIGLRVALTLDTLLGTARLGTELSASVKVWGPEFTGTASVSWGALSFDVSFGSADKPGFEPLKWESFQETYLPAAAESNKGWTASKKAKPEDKESLPETALQICQVNLVSGLVRESDIDGTGRPQWIVKLEGLEFSTQSAVPSTDVVPSFQQDEDPNRKEALPIGIRPMGGKGLTAVHRFTITKSGPNGEEPVPLDNWIKSARRGSVPKEIWDADYKAAAPQPSADVLTNQLLGFDSIQPPGPDTPTKLNEMSLSVFTFDVLQQVGPLQLTRQQAVSAVPPADGLSSELIFETVTTTLNEAEVKARRAAIISLARTNGFETLAQRPDEAPQPADAALTDLAANVTTLFVSTPPMLGPLGSLGTPPTISVEPVSPIQLPEKEPIPPETLAELTAIVFQYNYAEDSGTSDADVGATVMNPAERSTLPFDGIPGDAGQPPILPDPPEKKVTTGETLVWTIIHTDPRVPRTPGVKLRKRTGRVRIAALDDLRRLLETTIVDAGDDAQTVPLPPSTARVVVTSLPPRPPAATLPAGVAGWTASTSMIEMAPHTFLAENATVFTEGSYRGGASADEPDGRVLRGKSMIAENRLTKGRDSKLLRSGSFETALPADIATIAIIVRRGGIASGPSGIGPLVESTLADGSRIRLHPVSTFREDAERLILLYRVPAGLRIGQDARISVLTSAPGGEDQWEIQGVLGINESPLRVRLHWPDFRLRSQVVAAADSKGEAQVALIAV